MKILIISDTHGRHNALKQVMDDVGGMDMLIHLGDVEGGEEYIRSLVNCETHMVRGNNDFFSELPLEEEFLIENTKVFITHGHNYYVSLDPEEIKQEGRARDVDIVMFGHTHRPYFDDREDIVVLNPGSLSFPRQPGRQGSYMIMEMDENGSVRFLQKYLED